MTASTADSMAASMSDLDIQAAALQERLQNLQDTPADAVTLPDWLEAWSRVKCEIQTLWVVRYLAVKRDANDARAQAIYKHLMGSWVPKLDAYDEPLTRRALGAGIANLRPGVARKLEAELGGQHTEQLQEILAQERLLSSEYNRITSNQKVDLAGTVLTAREAQDRLAVAAEANERELLWRAIKQSDLEVSRDLDTLFTKLLQTRHGVALEAGRANYAEHVWRQTNRAYTIQEALEFLDGVAEVFAPLTTQLDRDRAAQLGGGRLRPWDLTVKLDAPARDTLEVEQYVATAERILGHLDPTFAEVVRELETEGRFDLLPRLGKYRGNLAAHLLADGTSEVLCSVTGGLREFGTLLHELGHVVHWHFISSNQDSTFWDFYDFQEVSEFCAFVFNILGKFHLFEDFELGPDEQKWYRKSLAAGFLSRLRDVDERVRMELWLYQQTQALTTDEIDAHYLTLYRRPVVDWSEHEDRLRKGWQNQFLFLHSFYNIEYSIATVAALLFVRTYQEDPVNALSRLKRAMQMGASAGPTKIFAEAGVAFPFSREQLVTARNVLANWLT